MTAAKAKSQARKPPEGAGSALPEHLGTGLIDDFDATVARCRFTKLVYQDGANESFAIRIDFEDVEVGGESAEDFTEHWSGGKLQFNQPIDYDGEETDLDSTDPDDWMAPCFKGKISRNSNAGLLLQSCAEAEAPIDWDASVLDGVRAHFKRIPQPKRSGIQVSAEGEETRERTYLAMTDVVDEKPKGRGKGKGRAAKGSKAKTSSRAEPASPSDDAVVKATEILSDALDEKESLNLRQRSQAVLANKDLKKPANKSVRAEVLEMIADADWLSEDDNPWVYDEDSGDISSA